MARRAGSGGGDVKWSGSEDILKVEPKGLPMDWMQCMRKREGCRAGMETAGLSRTRSCPWLSRALSGTGGLGGTRSRDWAGLVGGSSETAKDDWIQEPAVQGEGPSLGSDFDIH